MSSDTTSSLVGGWCDRTTAVEVGGADGLYAEVNRDWEAARPALPPSLLQALGKDEERHLAELIDRNLAAPDPAAVPPVLAHLHRAFVTEFDPDRERESCRRDLSATMALRDEGALLLALADLTRSGYGSPLHVTARTGTGLRAQVVPGIHSSPIPVADYDDRGRVAAYVGHMASMVRHIGGCLTEEQVADALELDRALWVAAPAEEPAADFPWQAFLDRVVGVRGRPWTPLVGPVTRRRTAAWWSGTVQQRRDWIVCRLAYDLGPFASEEALVQNSLFFAGRALGLTHPRPRSARFVSFAKTVAPDALADLYVADRGDDAAMDLARTVVEDLRREAIGWTEATFGPGTGEDCRVERMRGLLVELGHRPRGTAPKVASGPAGSSVCHLVMTARRSDAERQLAPIDRPTRAADWKIQAFTAAAYYQASANKVVIPWALMREPLLGSDLPLTQVYALFGTLVAHEMAHALLPASAEDWPEFVERARLGDVMEQLDLHARTTPGFTPEASHRREIAVDAIGFHWASRALAARVPSAPATSAPDPEFMRLWATRWRGTRPAGGDGTVHIDRHPPPELRCNIAPTYAGARPSPSCAPPLERNG